MKSILVKISSKSFNIPRAVRNKNSSPSRQNTSQTRQAKSSGKDLLYNVNILKNRAKFSQLLDKKNVSNAQKSTDCSLASLTLLKYDYPLCISEVFLLVATQQHMKQYKIVVHNSYSVSPSPGFPGRIFLHICTAEHFAALSKTANNSFSSRGQQNLSYKYNLPLPFNTKFIFRYTQSNSTSLVLKYFTHTYPSSPFLFNKFSFK